MRNRCGVRIPDNPRYSYAKAKKGGVGICLIKLFWNDVVEGRIETGRDYIIKDHSNNKVIERATRDKDLLKLKDPQVVSESFGRTLNKEEPFSIHKRLVSDPMESLSPQVVAAAKLSILNPSEFDLWKMRIEQLAKKNELKARGTLLMALPDKNQLKSNIHKDSKSLMKAIEKRLQKLISQLKILAELEDQSLDDLFNNLKIYEAEVKSSSSTSHTTKNIAFVSSQNTNNTNESVSVVPSVSDASTKPPASILPNVDNLSDVVIYSFFRTERNLGANGTTSIGFDMPKVKCYNCHRRGHFVRDKDLLKSKDPSYTGNEALAIPGQTKTGVNTPRCDEDSLAHKELMVTTLVLLSVSYIFIDGWFESFTFTNSHILPLIIQTLPLISPFSSSPQIIIAPLTFADTHNMIAFLTKSDVSERFDQIVDFLTAHTIQYALMVNPTIYVLCIKQFWASVSIKKSNDAVKLQALIDRKKVIITEDTIRQALRLDDADGIDSLPNEEIFADMVRNMNSPSKFLMYPRFLQVMINAQVDDLSSHNTKYTSLALTQKVFANMRRIAEPTQPSSPPQQQPTQPSAILKSSMTLLNTLMETCATLTQKVVNLEQDKVAQALEIVKLKQRVRKLEKKRRTKHSGLKRRMHPNRGEITELDADEDVTLVDVDADTQGRMEEDITAVKDINAAESEPTVFDDEEVTMSMAQTLIKMKAEKARILDEQMTKRLQDEEIEEYKHVQTFLKSDKDEEPSKKRVAKETLLQESFKKLRVKVEVLEKDYLLSSQVMTLMLSSRLQVEEDSEAARDLVMKIFLKANQPKKSYAHIVTPRGSTDCIDTDTTTSVDGGPMQNAHMANAGPKGFGLGLIIFDANGVRDDKLLAACEEVLPRYQMPLYNGVSTFNAAIGR
nr:hypothetical protein [Tanacetum cinerariifolium]